MKSKNSVRKSRSLRNKREAIFNELRERVINHHIPPGTRLRDSEIAKQYGVSRTLVRDVFQELARRGLLEIHRNQGIFVVLMDKNHILELLEIREALEGHMARLSAQRSTPEDWKGLENLFDEECAKLIKNLDFEEYLNRVNIFHNKIVNTSKNQHLQQMIDSIYDLFNIISRRTVILPHRAERSMTEHREVLKAILAKDPDRAEALNREHIRNVRENVIRYQDFIL